MDFLFPALEFGCLSELVVSRLVVHGWRFGAVVLVEVLRSPLLLTIDVSAIKFISGKLFETKMRKG
jgi:hypothetical protein